MTKIDLADSPAKYQNITFQISTPDGVMFVTILENEERKPVGFHFNIGKAGASIAAWSQALARVMSLALDNGATINDLIAELSSLTSDKHIKLKDGEEIRSGPDGVCYALFCYRTEKFKELTNILGKSDNGNGVRLEGRNS